MNAPMLYLCPMHRLLPAILCIILGTAPSPADACQDLFRQVRTNTLRLATFNVLNLNKDKSRSDKRKLAEMIRNADPDILVLQEVESPLILSKFGAGYLKGEFDRFMIPGNSYGFGLNIAFLVRKSLGFEIEIISHSDELWNDPTQPGKNRRLFTRDLPALLLRKEGAHSPSLIVLGIHNHSKKSRADDPNSTILRTAEANRTSEIIQRLEMQYGSDVPIVLAGDFNARVNAAPEYNQLWRSAHMEDVFNLLSYPPRYPDRFTNVYFVSENSRPVPRQLDAVLVNRALQDRILSARVYRPVKPKMRSYPRSQKERRRLPSDHFLVVAEFGVD